MNNASIKKPKQIDLTVFENFFDFVSQYILQHKREEKTRETTVPKLKLTDSGLGKLRYIAGRCIAKSKFHNMKQGTNNMYKKIKPHLFTNAFLK